MGSLTNSVKGAEEVLARRFLMGRRGGRHLSKIEFSCIEHFIEDVRKERITKVHLDLKENVRQSELSFIYYVSVEVVVTAQGDDNYQVYEYVERVTDVTTTEPRCTDEEAMEKATRRMSELKEVLTGAGFDVLHGRIVLAGDSVS
jgi:hypothetical protein